MILHSYYILSGNTLINDRAYFAHTTYHQTWLIPVLNERSALKLIRAKMDPVNNLNDFGLFHNQDAVSHPQVGEVCLNDITNTIATCKIKVWEKWFDILISLSVFHWPNPAGNKARYLLLDFKMFCLWRIARHGFMAFLHILHTPSFKPELPILY